MDKNYLFRLKTQACTEHKVKIITTTLKTKEI